MLIYVSALLLVLDMVGLDEADLRVKTTGDPWRSTLPDTEMIDCSAAENMLMYETFPRCKVQI